MILMLKANHIFFAYVSFNLISSYFFVLTFAMKLKGANYKIQCNILVFCDQ